MPDIDIRLLSTSAEMDAAVELQKIYWGEDMSALVPNHMLMSIANYGGHVHGAFDGDKMVGMLLGFIGADIDPDDTNDARQRMLVMSKRMVVRPEYRGQKIGERLKLAQADYARQHHIELVTWTFDPVLARNAYLNLHKLGGVGQKYAADYFGGGGDASANLAGDRLVVNWWVNHERVTKRKDIYNPPKTSFDTYGEGIIVNQTIINEQGLLVPSDDLHTDATDQSIHWLALEIPNEFVPLNNINPELGQQWRDHIRAGFQGLIQAGFTAVDLIRQPDPNSERERTYYLFVPNDQAWNFTQSQT